MVSSILIKGVKDPRVDGIRVTHVELTGDLRRARLYFTVIGDDVAKKRALEGLESAKGYIRTRLAKAVETRRVPEIEFLYDDSLDRSTQLEDLLKTVRSDD